MKKINNIYYILFTMTELMMERPKYIWLCNENILKTMSLYDNVYFTLRDIFINAESCDDVTNANLYNSELSGGICYEYRTKNFQYTTSLEEPKFLKNILKWLKSLKKTSSFEVINIDFNSLNEMESGYTQSMFMNFDDWWDQFEELIKLLEDKYEKLK
jgi:hypothetical protein